MKFKELLKNTIVSKMGGYKFSTSISGEEELTPHVTMDKNLQNFENIPFVNSGVNQLVSFIIGNKIEFPSKDKESTEKAKKWKEARPYLLDEIKNFVTLTVVCANVYTEDVKLNGQYNGFRTYPDPSRIYRNILATDDSEYWIMEVPMDVGGIDGMAPRHFMIAYIEGRRIWKYRVYGIPLHKNKLQHFKTGWSRDGIYGRSFLSSTINNNDIWADILKNIGVVAKYRALNNKIFMPDDPQLEFTEDDIEWIRENMLGLNDGEHVIMNRKITQQSITNQGEYDTMSQEADLLRRDTGSGLTPNYLTPWSQDNARATAAEAKPAFKLFLEEIQTRIEEYLTRLIIPQLRKIDPSLAPDIKIKFGDVALETWDERVRAYGDMYRDNVITLNEYRINVGLEKVSNGDKYYWQIQKDVQIPEEPIQFSNSMKKAFSEAFYRERLQEATGELSLDKFLSEYKGVYGAGDCRKAANKVTERVKGFKVSSYNGFGKKMGGYVDTHYYAEKGNVIIDLTAPSYIDLFTKEKIETAWHKNNRNAVKFNRQDYLNNFFELE